jgi:hypothetical protein
MSRPTRATLALITICSFGACSEAPQWPGSVEQRDGIEVIHNPADPLLPESEALVSELWTVHEPGWVDPSRVHARSGTVIVVDPPANQIHIVSGSGRAQRSIGRPGGGPGEFLRLLDAFFDGDRIVVLDAGKGSVEYLDLEGNHLASLHIDGQPWGGFPLGDGTLLVKGEFLSDPTEETYGDWVRIKEGEDPSAFSALALEPLPEEQGVRCSDLSQWAGGAARLRFTTPRIQVFDPAGDLILESRIDLPVEEVSDAERAAALSDLERRLTGRGLPPTFIQQNLIVQEERWSVKCRFGPLRYDSSGRLAAFLEQNPDEFGSGNATLHALTPDGIYLARSAFPTAWRDFTLDDGVIYALTRNPATDVVSLTAFQLDLPASGLEDATRVLDGARRGERGDRSQAGEGVRFALSGGRSAPG